jgi:hypothetical protein
LRFLAWWRLAINEVIGVSRGRERATNTRDRNLPETRRQ